MPREDDPCKHANPSRAECPFCLNEPPVEKVVVYTTEGGMVQSQIGRAHV